jgi:hypothetical protein
MNKIIHRRKICRGENAQAKRSSPGSIPSSSLGSELIVNDGIPGDEIQNQSAPVGGRKSFRCPPSRPPGSSIPGGGGAEEEAEENGEAWSL